MRLTEILEFEIETDGDQHLPSAILQASQLDKTAVDHAILPLLVRQVFSGLPESAQVVLHLPNLEVEKTPRLEHDDGKIHRPNPPRIG